MFIEPGVSYSRGHHTFSFNVPVAFYYPRHPNPITGNRGDATFPRHIFLSSYSIRLGRPAPPTTPPLPPATPRREFASSAREAPAPSGASEVCTTWW